MSQSARQKKGVWFWVGVALLSICALWWLLIVLTIAYKPEVGPTSVAVGLLVSAIPMAVGIICVTRRRKPTPVEEWASKEIFVSRDVETLARQKQKSIATHKAITAFKDTDNQVVVRQPTRRLVAGGFLFLMAGCIGTAAIVWGIADENIRLFIFFACAAVLFLWVAIEGLSNTTITFDHTLGNITMRQGLGPLTLRTRHISKASVRDVGVKPAKEVSFFVEFFCAEDDLAVSIEVAGRKKKIDILTVDYESSTHLANRIKAFVGSE